ncbi:hypothetical protein Nepgr_015771 [Nepenthes gracilis]|uniref:Uncharacterized protein n=1 Tax=Nepenthes gracilis TaxID=150966 RepID=A0AAD3SNF8_NEPGR|nr:hypothetical protein Nepgr_015771 [Nepenthes gracilis]
MQVSVAEIKEENSDDGVNRCETAEMVEETEVRKETTEVGKRKDQGKKRRGRGKTERESREKFTFSSHSSVIALYCNELRPV